MMMMENEKEMDVEMRKEEEEESFLGPGNHVRIFPIRKRKLFFFMALNYSLHIVR